ncbi:MAG TPA: NYN domain-containing protein [Gemmatales bacterium]|nr:NYN domain-containing protein [Gemmatales bacterium]HMP58644.1 NYN domain-containing protein [Gemmatales bacterium]
MRVLVDGYNVLFALGLIPRQLEPDTLHQARLQLLEMVRQHLGDRAREVAVFFDASRAPAHAPGDSTWHGISVFFARKKTEADDLIEHLVVQAAVPRRMTVISSDRRLRQVAERRGATAVRAEDFLEWLEREAKAAGPEQALAPGAASDTGDRPTEIGPEETAAWLKEFGHLDQDPELGRPHFADLDFGDLDDLDRDGPRPGKPPRR